MDVAKNIDIVKYTKDLLEIIQHDMYERAKERRDKLTFEAHNLDEMKQILETQPGFIRRYVGAEILNVKKKLKKSEVVNQDVY